MFECCSAFWPQQTWQGAPQLTKSNFVSQIKLGACTTVKMMMQEYTCQPNRYLPTLSILTSSILTLSIPIWSTSHFANSHFVNSHFVNIDQMGIDKVGSWQSGNRLSIKKIVSCCLYELDIGMRLTVWRMCWPLCTVCTVKSWWTTVGWPWKFYLYRWFQLHRTSQNCQLLQKAARQFWSFCPVSTRRKSS